MSRQHINAYRTKLAKLHAVSGSLNEGVLSAAFGGLLERWGRSLDLTLVNQWEGKGPRGNNIKVDGALVPDVLRIPFGYWEAKDSKDDLDKEITGKIAAGYPDDNIIYEDTVTAVLRQNGKEVDRAPLQGDDEALLRLLNDFFDYERAEIAEFRKAAAQFRADLPQILQALREAIGEAEKTNYAYAAAAKVFLDHAKEAINPLVTAADVREMLIQHILTEEIFTHVFDSAAYHRENNVAQKLNDLEAAFFTGQLRYATTQRLAPYYNAIRSAAAATADRREKQTFLKQLYEDFYRVYNPKAADRLGVVYTPGEIVRFMIRGAEWLCERHFEKTLIEPQVEILDPATGTGTFIVELLEHFAGDRDRLRYKYKNELHANEVAILPYYVANLNIEATYAAITDRYEEFAGLVFVDTLDNTAGLGIYKGHQPDMFGSFSDENIDRIKRQNDRKISVIIGNPPYFANQRNENESNKSRAYKRIDKHISDTYIRLSTARKTKRYDMYSRFFRWSSDRFRDNDGVLALVTNSNFIDAREADGFRKCVVQEFHEIWVVNLKGNARTSGERRRREGGNVFEDKIRVGVAVCFMVKKHGATGCRVFYDEVEDYVREDDKRAFISACNLDQKRFKELKPNANGDWLHVETGEGWPALIPVADPTTKGAKEPGKECAIFKLYSLGVVTARDDWVYARSDKELAARLKWFIDRYEAERQRVAPIARRKRRDAIIVPAKGSTDSIKFTRALKNDLAAGTKYEYNPARNRRSLYRPFVAKRLHFWSRLNEMQYQLNAAFRDGGANRSILLSGHPAKKPFQALATDAPHSYHTLEDTESLPRYRYTKSGERIDNITDWALQQFQSHYVAEFAGYDALSKDDIFAYVYAVLHDPAYREKYVGDLSREFPRIPFYPNFARWADWGRTLLDLHIGYEKVKPWKLSRTDTPGKRTPAPKLKSEPENGVIVLDSETQLGDVPTEAWSYRLGNRTAIDWVLDQHKEKKIQDSTVAAKFNTYRFADHKESVIKLLERVVRVSMETARITEAMKKAAR